MTLNIILQKNLYSYFLYENSRLQGTGCPTESCQIVKYSKPTNRNETSLYCNQKMVRLRLTSPLLDLAKT